MNLLKQTPFLHFIWEGITQPQKTPQVIQGMEKFFVCLIRLDSELLPNPLLGRMLTEAVCLPP